MGSKKFTNRASSTLAAGLLIGGTSLTVTTGHGSRFPALAAGQSFRAVIQAGIADTDAREFVLVTARAGDVLTIARGQEGSAAAAWSIGASFALVGTAATFDDFVQKAGDDLSGAINEATEAVIASAGTTDLATVNANSVQVTGTTAITALGTLPAGAKRQLRFAGALVLTHNAVSLINIGGSNITTAAGDIADMQSLGGGNWRMVRYQRIASLGGGATGGNGNQAFYENDLVITDDYTVGPNKNAGTFGPVTIASGVTVTVSPGCTWTIV